MKIFGRPMSPSSERDYQLFKSKVMTQKFAEKGLAATMEEYLSVERLDKMKATYRKRHGEYVAALAGQGLKVATQLPE